MASFHINATLEGSFYSEITVIIILCDFREHKNLYFTVKERAKNLDNEMEMTVQKKAIRYIQYDIYTGTHMRWNLCASVRDRFACSSWSLDQCRFMTLEHCLLMQILEGNSDQCL